MTHDYRRNWTIVLFAAMNIATGQVILKSIAAAVPPGLAVHVVLDNLSADSTPITKWLNHRDRRRWHLHFTPSSSSSLERRPEALHLEGHRRGHA
ncbi:MAG: hypothetical protein QOJ11_305 [Frankiales bacterium]|jgi:hypothetical protein|nr:hypothetical protein [Frankiales bacterium]